MDLLKDCHTWYKLDDDLPTNVVVNEITPAYNATLKTSGLSDHTEDASYAGHLGKCFFFDAADDDEVEANSGVCCNVATENWTAIIWMRGNNPRTSMNYFNKRDTGPYYYGYQLRDVGGVRVALICKTPTGTYSCGGYENPYDNNWHLYIAMREGSYIYLYLDNALSGDPGVVAGTLTTASYNLHIGCATNHAYYYNGYLDHFAFWKRALSVSERKWLWNNGNGQPNLISIPRPLVGGSLAHGRKGMVA